MMVYGSQKGRGFNDIFGTLTSTFKPIAEGAANVGASLATGLVTDLLSGKTPKTSIKERGNQAKGMVAQRALQSLQRQQKGSGKKPKSKKQTGSGKKRKPKKQTGAGKKRKPKKQKGSGKQTGAGKKPRKRTGKKSKSRKQTGDGLWSGIKEIFE